MKRSLSHEKLITCFRFTDSSLLSFASFCRLQGHTYLKFASLGKDYAQSPSHLLYECAPAKCTWIFTSQDPSSILVSLLHLKNPRHLHLLRHALLKWRWVEAELMRFGMPTSSVHSLNHIFMFWRGRTRNFKILLKALHARSVVSDSLRPHGL